jgi:hypothetical protein
MTARRRYLAGRRGAGGYGGESETPHETHLGYRGSAGRRVPNPTLRYESDPQTFRSVVCHKAVLTRREQRWPGSVIRHASRL